MRNSDHFLDYFTTIEKWLRTAAGADRSVPFTRVVSQVATQNRAVKKFQDDLREYADLRNAIVHERGGGHVIAEPNDRAVAELARICKSLMEPPSLIPKFQISVRARTMDESIGEAVRDMRQGSFSQLPILNDGVVTAVLTTETVARWLALEFDNDVVSLLETKISQVLPHTEDNDHYCFLSRQATLLDALFEFEKFASRGKDLDAILITNDGKPNQQMLGIITLFDLPVILAELGLKRMSATNY